MPVRFLDTWRQSIDQAQRRAMQKLDQLPARDLRALILLTIFLLVALVGWSVYSLNHKAVAAQQKALGERETLTWMRSQAPHLKTDISNAQPLGTLLRDQASMQGMTIAVVEQGPNQVQITASHANYSVLASFLMRMAEQGMLINSVSMQQVADKSVSSPLIQLQATVSQPL